MRRQAPRLVVVLAAIAIVLLATNVRIVVGSLGVVLDEVRADLDMSPSVAGILTTLPLLCFAALGYGAPRVIRRWGLHRTAVWVLLVLAAGLAGRSVVGSAATFLLLTMLALGAAAVGNVILPPLVKANFPTRIALMSSVYGAAVMTGVSLASISTVPLSDALGSWRAGLGAWAVMALVGAVPWLFFATPQERVRLADRVRTQSILRSRTMWALASCFGLQSAHAYAQFGWYPVILTDAGMGAERAGVMLALVTGIGIPLTLCIPLLLRWFSGGPVLPVTFGLATAIGWAGVLWSPLTLTWLWSLCLGLGGICFTWTLTMIGQKATTAEATASLSAGTQGIGYFIAGVGPLSAGIMRDLSGSWDLPVTIFLVASVSITVSAWAVVHSPQYHQAHSGVPLASGTV